MASTAVASIEPGSTFAALEIPDLRNLEWDALVRTHPAGRCIVPKWEELAGWTNHAIGLFKEGTGGALVAGLDLALRRIPKLPLHLSRVSRIMLAEGREIETLEVLLHDLERFAMRHLVIETELRLRIPATDDIAGFGYHRATDTLLKDFGYRPLSKVDTTYFIDLDRDDDGLLRSFSAKARNKIRKAQKGGAVVEISKDYSLLDDFYEAYLDMGERKSAPIPPKRFVGEGLVPLLDAGVALLVTESYQDKVSNMVIVDALGIPCYALGARTKANVLGEVPGAAQVLHYEVMKMLRARKKAYYDLGGCEGPIPIEGHPNFGVWHFKHAFSGRFVRFLPYYRKVRGSLLRPVMDAVHRLRGDYV
jgi:hypothetical protein